MIERKELIRKYLDFFNLKEHKEIQNSSLVPENDPTVLFTTAGMHPLVPYLLGQKHPLGKRLCNIQRCIRTDDIEEVGDEIHLTFFEMLGNWSLGDYWKKDAITYSLEFFTDMLNLPMQKLGVSCFEGDKDAPKDTVSAEIWLSLGVPKERISFLPKKENWWGPVGGKKGICGPDTEIFYWNDSRIPPKKFDIKDKKWVEIGNDVLMQYVKEENGKYKEAAQKNVDFGGGVERILSAVNGIRDIFLSEIFSPIIETIEKISRKKYGQDKEITKAMRIIADHVKASAFIIADDVLPGNSEQGYVLRRLIRRAARYGKELGLKNFLSEVAIPVFDIYEYSHLQKKKQEILREIEKEEKKFEETLEKGINQFKKFASNKKISGKEAFLLYQSYGFPIEMIEEECKKSKVSFSREEFKAEQKRHQELSKTAAKGKFKSGLSDSSEQTTKLHTAAHLLLSALRVVLKDKNIIQRGSNITPERLRLDYSFPRSLTAEEIKKIENLVNAEISKSQKVVKEEMSPQEAKKKGFSGIFDSKYGDRVSVYSIGSFSKEICAGPHVQNTSEIGKFKIIKEESSSAGVRRIKAIVE